MVIGEFPALKATFTVLEAKIENLRTTIPEKFKHFFYETCEHSDGKISVESFPTELPFGCALQKIRSINRRIKIFVFTFLNSSFLATKNGQ